MDHQDDATPREPSSLDKRLQAEEPPIQADDTNPSRPVTIHPDLAARLRAEEPPIQAEDTTPTAVADATDRVADRITDRITDRIAAEEPPIQADDTNPSRPVETFFIGIETRRFAPDVPPRREDRASLSQRLLGLAMLLGAVVLTGLAAMLWMSGDDDESQEDRAALAVTASATPSPTHTPAATQPAQIVLTRPVTATVDPSMMAAATVDAESEMPGEATLAVTARPTAAADEIAVALLAAPVQVASSGAIARDNVPFTIRPGSQRTHVISYTVQDGDTLESIAARFELKDYYTLVWSNSTNKYNPLRPGVDLNVPPVDGVYYEAKDTISIAEVAQELGVDPYSIIDAEYNNLFGSTPETLLVKGMRVMVPGGQAQRDLFFLAAPSGTGTVSGGVVTGTYSLWGCTSEISGGTMPYGRPLERYTYMQGFRVGGHTGVDIAPGSGRVGDPIYASGGGTVAYAGWSDGGYGYVVVIAHGSVFSLYAHMNGQPSVSCGQKVSQGSVIGMVGSSGNSSGPHLHFEVRDANFNLLDPASYVSF